MIKIVKVLGYFALRYYDDKLDYHYKLNSQIAIMLNISLAQYNEILENGGAREIADEIYAFNTLDAAKVVKELLDSIICMNSLSDCEIL